MTAAWSFWTETGDGGSVAGTGSLIAPTNTVATAPMNSSTVAVNWSAGRLATGETATGYYAVRIRNSDSAVFAACGTSASAPSTALSCNDVGVIDGAYHYRVTGLFGSWTAVGGSSNDVTVVNDSSLPSITVTSISPTPNGNGYNSTMPVVVNLSASAGAGILSITYAVDNGVPVTVMANTASVSVAGNAIHNVTFSAKDVAMATSATESVLVRIDTVAPAAASAPNLITTSDTGASTTDGITKATAPTFTGTAEEGAAVTLYDGATVVGSAVATSTGYIITSSTLAQGSHTLTARIVDLAGNAGPVSSSTTVVIDTTAPATPSAPVLAAASDSGASSSDRITNITNPTFTGTAEAGTTVTLYNSSTVSGSGLAISGPYSIVSSALASGARSMTVKATDVAGNISAASAITTVTIDITAPAKPGTPVLPAAFDTGRSAADRNTKITTPTFTGTTTAGSTVTLFDGSTQVGIFAATTSTYTISSSTLTSATHTITTKNTDLAGNLGPASTAITVIVDTVAPVAPSVPKANTASDSGRSSTDGITKVTSPVVTGTNETRMIVAVYDGAAQVATVTTTTATYSVATSTLAEGSHSLTATATDIAGNLGVASAAGVLIVDVTAPASASTPVLAAASDTGISNSDLITNDTTATFSGTGADGLLVTLYDGATATGTGFVVTGSAYTATTAVLTSGQHTISAVSADVAGNLAPASGGITITIDTVAPTVILNQASGQVDPATSTPVSFAATFSEAVYSFIGTDVTVSGTAGANTALVSGGPTTYGVAVSTMTKTGTVVATVAAAKATDAAGNQNLVSTSTDNTVSYIDTVAPSVIIASFSAGGSRTAVLSGTAGFGLGDTLTVTVVVCTQNVFPCAVGNTKATLSAAVNASTGVWSVTSGTLGTNLALYAGATQTDLSGNSGTSAVAGPVSIP